MIITGQNSIEGVETAWQRLKDELHELSSKLSRRHDEVNHGLAEIHELLQAGQNAEAEKNIARLRELLDRPL